MKKECPHLKNYREMIIDMVKSSQFRNLFFFLLTSLKVFPLLKKLGIKIETNSFCKLTNNLCPHAINSKILDGVLNDGYKEDMISIEYPDFYESATLGQGNCNTRRQYQAENN